MDYLVSHLILLSVLVVIAIYFSAVETCLLSLPRAFVESQAEGPGILPASFREWMDHPNRILTSILIGSNIASIAATTLVAYMAVHMAEVNAWSRTLTGTVASVGITFVLIVFGEAIPKVMARSYSEKTAAWLIVPVYLFDLVMKPATWSLARMIYRYFPKLSKGTVSSVTEEDVKHLLEIGEKAGTIQEEEKKMIHSIFKFTDTKVVEVMVPRTDMFIVDILTPMDKLVDLVIHNGYSRVPVFKGTRENIVGILHVRDLLSIWKHRELIVLQDLLHRPFFVPETMRVDRLLREFKHGKMHLAVVVDEYGGIAGLVTMENLLEEIVGDIRDETDQEEEKAIQKQEDGSWIIEAGVPLSDVNEAIGIHLEPKGEVTSLGGYLSEKCGRVPKKGRVVQDREAVFSVLEASDRKVSKVKIVKREVPLPEKKVPVPGRLKKRKPKAEKTQETPTTTEEPSSPAQTESHENKTP
jgi:putative hemolysin